MTTEQRIVTLEAQMLEAAETLELLAKATNRALAAIQPTLEKLVEDQARTDRNIELFAEAVKEQSGSARVALAILKGRQP